MKVKSLWLKCEDEDGKEYMVPATDDDIRQLQAIADSKAVKDLEAANSYIDSCRQF
jgi:hypothetical protein